MNVFNIITERVSIICAPRATPSKIFIVSIVMAIFANIGVAQNPSSEGQWSGPFTLGLFSNPPTVPVFDFNHAIVGNAPIIDYEIGHCCLIPQTNTVLVWNPQQTQFTPTGSFCSWYNDRTYRVWIVDPINQSFQTIDLFQVSPVDSDMFCSGHTWRKDGTLLIVGGNAGGQSTVVNSCIPSVRFANEGYIFDPATLTFTKTTMNKNRWYPTAFTQDNDSSFVIGGTPIQEWEYLPFGTSNWILESDPTNQTPFQSYPRIVQLSSGALFTAQDQANSYQAIESWTFTTSSPKLLKTHAALAQYHREDGTAVILHKQGANGLDRVIAFGGGPHASVGIAGTPLLPIPQTPTSIGAPYDSLKTVEEFYNFDPTGANPPSVQKKLQNSTNTGLNSFRQFCNSVTLPTGKVLLVGGAKNDYQWAINTGQPGAVGPIPILTPELFDPGSASNLDGSTQNMADQRVPRVYHSTSLLMPDARVLSMGGENVAGFLASRESFEIFSPPYLFQGARPRITVAPPASITYGNPISLTADSLNGLSKVVLIRPGAVTHAFDADQRYIELAFTSTQSGRVYSISATAPADSKIAPSGYYMLFVVSATSATITDGIPSVAAWVHL
ncbi:MAG: DUF1929 domain-containing protein [Planctomycetes bacterium]|nr:DUF1929 domain-containing protein [Planctomycetota bacterium]